MLRLRNYTRNNTVDLNALAAKCGVAVSERCWPVVFAYSNSAGSLQTAQRGRTHDDIMRYAVSLCPCWGTVGHESATSAMHAVFPSVQSADVRPFVTTT